MVGGEGLDGTGEELDERGAVLFASLVAEPVQVDEGIALPLHRRDLRSGPAHHLAAGQL